MNKNISMIQRLKRMDSVLWINCSVYGRQRKIKGIDDMRRQRRVSFVYVNLLTHEGNNI
jgi:hypothetical protein